MDGLSGIMKQGLFITGTDTDVGKTVVSRAILKYLNDAGLRTLGVKPVCCGGREDVTTLQEVNASAGFSFAADEVNPLFLSEPAAPISIAGELPELPILLDALTSLTDAPLLVEGAGGWAVPVSDSWGMQDLAVALGLPVIMVVANKLGALNHSVLTAQAIQQAGLPLLGYVLNTVAQTEYAHAQGTNRVILDQVLDAPCLAEVPLGGGFVPSEPLRTVLQKPDLSEAPLDFVL